MKDGVTKTDIIVFASIFFAMIATLVYGFFVIGVGKLPDPTPTYMTCWGKYSTEQEAILNCEGNQ